MFGRINTQGNQSIIYKTTDYGHTWNSVFNESFIGDDTYLMDVDVLETNPDKVIVVGYIKNHFGNNPNNRTGLFISTDSGFINRSYQIQYVGINEDILGFSFVNYLPNGEIRILANDGIYNQSFNKIYSIPEISQFTPEYGFNFTNNNSGLAALNNGKLIETTDGGYNWFEVLVIGGYGTYYSSSEISTIGQIAYYGDATSSILFTRKLSTNFQTYFDNQSTPSLISFNKLILQVRVLSI